MAASRPPGDASGPPSRRRRSRSPYGDGLRTLGEQIDGPTGGATGATGTGAGVANEEGLRALGDQVARAGGHRGKKKARTKRRGRWSTRRKVLTVVSVLVVLALVVVAAAYGYARYRYDQIKKVHVAAEHTQVSGQPFNMLVIGSDSRVGNSKATATYGTSTAVGGQRSDVTMIWHVDPATKQISVVSIPRDTMVQMVGKNVATFGQFNRINSSYNTGPTLLVQTIQDNFGIPIAHVVQVDFSGFKGAVNALGGVHMDFKYPTRTFNETPNTYGVNESGLDVTTPGCVLLTGKEALAVARSRHYQYEATGTWQTTGAGDLGRIKRQDAFLRALIDEAKTKYNPLTLNAFLGSLPQGIAIDTNFSLSDLVGLAEDFHSINPTAIQTTTLPTFTIGYVTPWGDVLFVQQPAAQQLLVSIFGTELTTPQDPPPDTALVASPPPTVSTTTPTQATAAGSVAPTAPPPTYDPTPCS